MYIYTKVIQNVYQYIKKNLYKKIIINKSQRIPKGQQSRMDNAENLTTWGNKTRDEDEQIKNTTQYVAGHHSAKTETNKVHKT